MFTIQFSYLSAQHGSIASSSTPQYSRSWTAKGQHWLWDMKTTSTVCDLQNKDVTSNTVDIGPSEAQEHSHRQTCGTFHWRGGCSDLWPNIFYLFLILQVQELKWTQGSTNLTQDTWNGGCLDEYIFMRFDEWVGSLLGCHSMGCSGWELDHLRYISRMAGKFSGFLKKKSACKWTRQRPSQRR